MWFRFFFTFIFMEVVSANSFEIKIRVVHIIFTHVLKLTILLWLVTKQCELELLSLIEFPFPNWMSAATKRFKEEHTGPYPHSSHFPALRFASYSPFFHFAGGKQMCLSLFALLAYGRSIVIASVICLACIMSTETSPARGFMQVPLHKSHVICRL